MKPELSPYTDAHPRTIHFIAVCGVAMASVATEMQRAGFNVTGSDTAFYPPMGTFLNEQNVKLYDGFKVEHLPRNGLVVVGNAVSRGNVELEAALDLGLPLVSLPELITHRYITNQPDILEKSDGENSRRSVVVTGTHGKTTTTTMITHILRFAERNPGWMVGGLPADLPYPCEFGTGCEFVIEGDEYDAVFWDKRPKFLHYRPHYLIINSVEFDHSDIYKNIEEIELQFQRLVRLVPRSGVIAAYSDSDRVRNLCRDAFCPVTYFGSAKNSDWTLDDDTIAEGDQTTAEFCDPEGARYILEMGLSGKHNLHNVLAAIAMASNIGVNVETAVQAMKTFRGVARRLEQIYKSDSLIIYDDFAHHPTAIKLTLETLRRKHPEAKIWTAVEPRSNTMVKNIHQGELIDALQLADHVMLGKLHREERIPENERLDRGEVKRVLESSKCTCFLGDKVESMINYFIQNRSQSDVLVMMSNGSFGGMKEKMLEVM